MTSSANSMERSLRARVKQFVYRPWREKLKRLRLRWLETFPWFPLPMRLPFGVWWLARNDHISRPMIEGQFETGELNFVCQFLRPGMVVLDIGANHGLYTLLASKRVGPTGKIIAFEPSLRERKALRLHLVLNRCQNVIVQDLALGNESGECQLYVVEDRAAGCNSLRPPVVDAKTSLASVRVARLDEVLLSQNIDRVDFIKLDVEGAELDVLKGALRLLRTVPRPVLLVEVYDIRTQPWGYKARDIVEFLDQNRYRWFELLGDGCIRSVAPHLQAYDANLVAIPEESPSLEVRNGEVTENV